MCPSRKELRPIDGRTVCIPALSLLCVVFSYAGRFPKTNLCESATFSAKLSAKHIFITPVFVALLSAADTYASADSSALFAPPLFTLFCVHHENLSVVMYICFSRGGIVVVTMRVLLSCLERHNQK